MVKDSDQGYRPSQEEGRDHIDAEMATSDVDLDIEVDSGDDSIYFHTEGIEQQSIEGEYLDGESDEDDVDEVHADENEGHDEDEDDDDNDEDALNRLSQQTIRRRDGNIDYGVDDDEDDYEDTRDTDGDDDDDEDDDDEEEEGDEDDDEDEDEGGDLDGGLNEFLRRLIQARSRHDDVDLGNRGAGGNTGADTGSGSSDTAEGQTGEEQRGHEFIDVIQRLMGGGIIQGGPGNAHFGGGVGGIHSEIDALISNLSQREDTFLILESLNELSERLLMMNGITAERVIPANRLAKCLINIMQDPALAEDLELHLVSCRCLYNFLEVNQDFIHDALNNGAVEALCQKLLEINYIDLTEQALQTLEMISRDPISHESIVNCNGLKACLQYLDFFTVHAQRKSLLIVANSCIGGVNSGNFAKIESGEVFEMLSNVVRSHDDAVVVENGWSAISRIIMSVKLERGLLEDSLFGGDKISFANEMVAVILRSCSSNEIIKDSGTSPGSSVSFGTSLNLIRSLIVLVSVGIKISRQLMEHGIGSHIVETLIRAGKKKNDKKDDLDIDAGSLQISSLMNTPKELLSQFLTLIGYLLPISGSIQSKSDERGSAFYMSTEKAQVDEMRVKLCQEDDKIYYSFVNDIWGLLIYSFQATMDSEIRRKILTNLFRIVSFARAEDFSKINSLDSICRLLTSVANQSKADQKNAVESYLLLTSLKTCRLLVEKAGGTLMSLFEKEGLINDIESILRRNGVDEKEFYDLVHAESDDIENDDDVTGSDVDQPMSSQSILASLPTKYIDYAFTKDFDSNLDSDTIYRDIVGHCRSILIESRKFKNEVGGKEGYGTSIKLLEEVGLVLKSKRNTLTYPEWCDLFEQMKTSIKGRESYEGISSFELMSSGIITQLVDVLNEDNRDEACYNAFMEVFIQERGIELLVEKLQECLTRSESFEIVGTQASSQSSGQGSGLNFGGGFMGNFSGLSNSNAFSNNKAASMARQVKIKLEGDTSGLQSEPLLLLPPGMQNLVLSIHAIATFKSVDAFLNQRFKILAEMSGARERFEKQRRAREAKDEETEEEVGSKEETSDSSDATDFHLEFLINGEVIPKETTIYGAIYRSMQDEGSDVSKLWSTVHAVQFRKIKGAEEENKQQILSFGQPVELRHDDDIDSMTMSILSLLKILFEMNSSTEDPLKRISNNQFKNWKLTVKLNRQLEEPLIVASGTLPGWCITLPKQFPMIFPLDTRIFFLQSTSFGYSRLIHHWQMRSNQEEDERNGNAGSNRGSHLGGSNDGAGNGRPQLGRPARHKVRLSRKMLLQSAVKVLGMYGSAPGVLEIEYFDEIGSGLGPTLEFYSTVSREFCNSRLLLWRKGEGSEEEYNSNKYGLFPVPLSKAQLGGENGKKVLFFFNVLGKFIARGMLDSRIVDFNFNPVFFKVLLVWLQHGQPQSHILRKLCTLANLRQIDPALADSMEKLIKFKNEGHEVEDLGLSFELPGYPNFDLGAGNSSVTSANLETYIHKVIETTIYSGVSHQVKAFMDGFSKVFPVNSLIIFSPEELVSMFGNGEEDWSRATLVSYINADHGYTKESPTIKNLIEILYKLNNQERRSFLQFLTGAPKLPIGGFKALKPELTVVKKSAEAGLKDDDYLPSVMTCANYLKLPNYSSEEVMRVKLLQAINEGAGAFLLS